MTREHWIGYQPFFPGGNFEHVEKLEDPIVVLRHETKVSYPQPDGPKWRIAAERFEGLARSFLIAARCFITSRRQRRRLPLKEYYSKQILLRHARNAQLSASGGGDISGGAGGGWRSSTRECASLVIGLSICREVIWENYTKAEKDRIADYLSNFGHCIRATTTGVCSTC